MGFSFVYPLIVSPSALRVEHHQGLACFPAVMRDSGWCHTGPAGHVMMRLYSCAWYSTRRERGSKGALLVPQDRRLWNQNTALSFTLSCDNLGKWWLGHLLLISGKFQPSCFSAPNWFEEEKYYTAWNYFVSNLLFWPASNKTEVDIVLFCKAWSAFIFSPWTYYILLYFSLLYYFFAIQCLH